jgi:hypothetical protein
VRLGGTDVPGELVIQLAGLLRLAGLDTTAARLESALAWGEPVVPLTSLDRDSLLHVLVDPRPGLQPLRAALLVDREHDRAPGTRVGLRCTECGCVSEAANGWMAFLADDAESGEEGAEVVFYCPPCAAGVLEYVPRGRGYT